jgi:hypothetical protein
MRRDMKAVARAILAVVAVLVALLACDPLATPTVQGNVVVPTIITLPPAWTPTWDGKPSPIPGWALVSGNGVELQLPTSYDGGNPEARTQFLIDLVSRVPGYEELAELLRENPVAYQLLAMDVATGSIVAVTRTDVPPEMRMADYVDGWVDAVRRLSPGSSEVDRQIVQFREQETGRVVMEFVVEDQSSWQLSYLVRRDAEVWTFNFGALKDDFYQIQPVFEQSMQSMQFLPIGE